MSVIVTLAPLLGAAAVRALGASLRLSVDLADGVAARWRAGAPVIYAVWHGRILLMPWLNARLRRTHGARRVTVLASRSRDGELVARYARGFDLDVVRGSSSRGGAVALRTLVGVLGAGRDVAVVPDGPRGPCCRVQPGVVALAALTGAPVVPLALGAHPARRLRSWDAFLLPAPFARCAAVFGPPIEVARDADRARAAAEVEHGLVEATAAADRLVCA
ncbi:MAG: hypothetical protein A2W08_01895 [Candidatus Rokubacteria bacterium RBG_16_73_20]|nr:MAG: hypothetical protein A2W08_01895 [Candidatus Rokubacteria bacterium RBG_16_73_20]